MKRILLFLIIGLISTSCWNDVDFNQADSFEVIAPYTFSFIYSDFYADDFENNGTQSLYILKEFSLKLNPDIIGRVYSDVTLSLDSENSFLDAFNIEFEFKNSADNVLYTHALAIPAHNSISGSTIKHFEFIIPLEDFKQTSMVVVKFTALVDDFTIGGNKSLGVNSTLSFDVKY
ncbi:MAG: hypothetical protein CR968_03515 [Flavobacteriia bacterium]|nr:MAG: hypothetical protein CR968_03515 [Flavobacteriia bacterium]